jgi:GT2 family glycosyltransferase
MTALVGIVVPTLGVRPTYLIDCLKSIRNAGHCHILLVAPNGFDVAPVVEFVDQIETDPKQGLAEAINFGFISLPQEVRYVNWLGDDDKLEPNSFGKLITVLEESPKAVAVFGQCDYIDQNGKKLFTSRFGTFALRILNFGPDLIPQPGALICRSAIERIGFLDVSYRLAFDFDMFIRLKKIGEIKYLNQVVASFRWHDKSMSVESRELSVSEARLVRARHMPRLLRYISAFWEIPLGIMTK